MPLACGMTSSGASTMSMKYVKRVKLTKGWKEAGDGKKKSAPIMSTLKTSERPKIFMSAQTMMTIHSRDEGERPRHPYRFLLQRFASHILS